MPDIKCLALDMGGVICADVWESLFLAPETGLVARLGLDLPKVHELGSRFWHRYAYATHAEDDYWKEWEAGLGISVDRGLVRDMYQTAIWTDKTAAGVIEGCLSHNVQVAIVSNSTSFWFPLQMTSSGLDPFADRLKYYLSHEIGYFKTHPQGGLAKLAQEANPQATLFIDDRLENIKSAQSLGMQTLHYQRDRDHSLAETLGFKSNPNVVRSGL